jgi:hypothetical protein
VETGVTTTGTSGRERDSSGSDTMMGSGLITEVVCCDGVTIRPKTRAGVSETVVVVKKIAASPIHGTSIAFVSIDVREKMLNRNTHFLQTVC